MADGPVRLTREPIDAAAIVAALRRDEAGALAAFEGTVRAERSADGRPLAALDYFAFEEMALEQLRDLHRRALALFDVLDAVIVHRIGRMALGETSIAVVVVSAHRAAAFDACRWLIDAIKTDVPIWKKQVWHDGTSSWTEPTHPP